MRRHYIKAHVAMYHYCNNAIPYPTSRNETTCMTSQVGADVPSVNNVFPYPASRIDVCDHTGDDLDTLNKGWTKAERARNAPRNAPAILLCPAVGVRQSHRGKEFMDP